MSSKLQLLRPSPIQMSMPMPMPMPMLYLVQKSVKTTKSIRCAPMHNTISNANDDIAIYKGKS